MKQFTLFENTTNETNYTSKIEAPVYEPKGKQPHVLEIFDTRKTGRLIHEIDASSVLEEEKQFLREAAKRHTVFNYEKIADYYAHASKEMQDLMERSALVIIDFDKAIQHGYVKLCDNIRNQYLEEYEK